MPRADKIRMLMEDRGWVWDEDDEPAIKYDRNGMEMAREGDEVWKHDYEEAVSIL